MTKFYHYTAKRNIESILQNGLLPGLKTGQKEALPFVMFTKEKYAVRIGNIAYFEVEIDKNDPKLRMVNKVWAEYSGDIKPEAITALANPPSGNEEVVELMKKFGLGTAEYKKAFSYQLIEN